MSLTDQAVRPPIDARTSGWRSDEGGASRWRGPATAAPRRRSGSDGASTHPTCPRPRRRAPLPQLGAEQRRDVVHEQRAHGRLPVVARVVPGEDEALLRARDRRVEEEALGVDGLLVAAQDEPGGRGELTPLGVAEEGLGSRRPGEAVLLHAAQDQRAHPPGPQRERLADGHRTRARLVAQADVELLEEAGQLGGLRRQPREVSEIAERSAPGGQHAGVGGLRAVEDRGLSRVRRGEPSRQLGRQRLHERPRTAVVRGGDAVDRVERPALALPQLAGRSGRPGALLAGPRLQAVGERRLVQEPRRAQPGQEVLGGAVEQRAAQQRDEPRAEWRVPEDRAPLERDRHARGGEHAAQGRRDGRHVACDDRDLLRRDAVLPDQPRDLRGDELELRTLPAALHQGDRGVGGVEFRRGGVEQRAVLRRLEQPPLEVVQRRRRVVVGDRRELDHAVGHRAQRLDGLRAAGERVAAGLERQ